MRISRRESARAAEARPRCRRTASPGHREHGRAARRAARARARPGKRLAKEAQPSLLEGDDYKLPPLALLAEPRKPLVTQAVSTDALEQNARLLEGVLEDFGVRGEIINVRPGPVVTLYELEPAPGIKSSRVIGLADDIARSMCALSARVAVVPGRNAIGIELPNAAARDRLSPRAARLRGLREDRSSSWRSASARPSAASRSSPSSPACRICSSPAPPARASRSPSTP